MSEPPNFQLECPSEGGSFYACDYGTRFLGCCADTTKDQVCTGRCDDLRAATFDANYYNYVPPNDCGDFKSQWYTCASTIPPFMGCCRQNPCSGNGCPQDELTPAQLSTNETRKAAFSSVLIEKPSAAQEHIGAIAGGAAGGLAIIVTVTFIILWFRWKKARSQRVRLSNDKKSSEGILS